jgi:Carboxypeptidase regulatory-like domain/TonB dependent receptor-like, beta-barrel
MGVLRVMVLGVALPLLMVSTAAAQGVQTGEVSGTVSSSDGLTLPGATITAAGPALQGVRTVVADAKGNYVIRALPPGTYKVTFEMSGLSPRSENVVIELGRQTVVNATLALAGVAENVNVTAEVSTAGLTSPTVGANYTATEINQLPTGRTPALIAELAPGLTANTPNSGQVTISGGFAYDNVFMINGVDVNDNLFGSAQPVFIEDAVEQTSVLTSGISAEYGRFSGGVINMITKSGGNTFSGSFRSNLSNNAWTVETPREKATGNDRRDKLNPNYEATLGGPIVRDRLWFFTAGRWQDTSNTETLPETNLPFETTTKDTRFEAKGTGTIAKGHTLQVNYIRDTTDQTRLPFGASIDPNVAEHPSFPNRLFVASYNGILNRKLLANFQVSQKKEGFRGTGGFDTDIHASPFFTIGVAEGVPGGLHYNGNYFDATDPEDRDNFQYAGSLSYFAATPRGGSHDLKGGFEHFKSNQTGGNSQSASGYVFDTDYVPGDNGPAFDADGRIIPTFVPGATQLENWIATRGANLDIRTLSFYLQDNWSIGPRLTLNLGVRHEIVKSEATGGIIGVDTSTTVPRLAATYDLSGHGDTVLQASYAHYSGKYNEAQIGRNSPVANPAEVIYDYTGPEGQGRDFAPGFDLANYEIVFGSFPTANIFLDSGLSSPITREFSASVGQQIGQRGMAKLTYTNRSYSNFIEDFIDNPTVSGRTDVVVNGTDFGTFDNIVYRNSDLPERKYQALLFQANYRPWSRLSVDGHWTVQLKNEGNFEGEAQNQPGISSSLGDYPEILVPSRNFPVGRLNGFQRNKVRLWAIYNQPVGRFGSVDVAPILRVDSGTAYSLFATDVDFSDVQLARDPGYAHLPDGGTQTLFFGERGAQTFPGFALLDLAATYQIPVFRTVRPWVKVEILNLTNNQKLISWDTTVTPDPNSQLDANGLPTGYIQGPRFGQATANTDYPAWRPGQTGGRTYLLSGGIRF